MNKLHIKIVKIKEIQSTNYLHLSKINGYFNQLVKGHLKNNGIKYWIYFILSLFKK